MTHRFHPEARFEFREDALFYESCRTGLGRRFRDAVRDAIASIVEDPLRWPLFEGGTRRCVMRRFPYAIVYLLEHDTAFIVAVMHCSREPGYWHERTDSDPA